MTTISLPVTSRGTSDANNFSDVKNNDQAIIDVVNGNLTNGNLTGSAGITDANLASPNNSAYKLFGGASASIASTGLNFATGAYYFIGSGGAPVISTDNTPGSAPPAIIVNSLYQVVAGKTQKIRTVATCATNATASGVTYTVGLYPISSVAGAADQIAYTLGTVTTGSTVAFASPSTSTATSSASAADISLPANGLYTIGVALSGTPANHSVVQLSVQILTRNV